MGKTRGAAMQDELDRRLQSLFREQNQNLPEEPFLGHTLGLIEKHRSRRVFRQSPILLAAVVCCALLSRFLIKGSVLLSGYLEWIFGIAGMLLNKPAGTLIAALCCAVLLFVFRRRLISTFV
jgi:hypothetical protein